MKFQKLMLLVIGVILIVVLVACGDEDNDMERDTGSSSESQNGFENNFSLVSWMSEYGVTGEHRFYDVNMYEALQLLDDEDFDGILLFAFPECPWCQEAVPVIHEASQATNVDVFYVSRAHAKRVGDWLAWDASMAWWLYENGVNNMAWINEDGQVVTLEGNDAFRPNISVPQIVHLRASEILGNHRGTFEGHYRLEDGSLPELTDEQRAILLGLYIEIFTTVNETEACPLPLNPDEYGEDGCS